MPSNENDANEAQRLRDTMRDLIALSTLPAVWAGYSPEGVAQSFAGVLRDSLDLDLVYVRIQGFGGVEVACGKEATFNADQLRVIAQGLSPLLVPEPPVSIADPLGSGEFRVAVARFGHAKDRGTVVACSRRTDFPTETDRLLLGIGTNQTAIVLQRKQAESALEEERKWLRVTLSSIGDAVIATDAKGRVTFMNGVAESLTGWSIKEAQGRSLSDVFCIVNEYTRETGVNPALRALSEGITIDLGNHTVLIARDGTERPIDDSAAPIRDGTNAPTGAVLVFRDLTERRRAEERRHTGEERLHTALAAARMVTWEWTSTDRKLRVSETAAEVFGLPAGVGLTGLDQGLTLVHPDDVDMYEATFRYAIERRGNYHVYYRLIRPSDGRTIWIEERGNTVFDQPGGGARLFGVSADVTARVEAEAALRASERRFRALVTATSDVVYRMNRDWSEMRHLDGSTVLANTDEPSRSWLERYIPADERAAVKVAIAEAITNKKPFELEHRVNLVDGTVGWTFSRAIPVLDAAGEIVEWFGAASDVTHRRRAEAEAAQMAEKLRLALEAGDLGTWEWDPTTDEMIVSDRTSEIYGTPPGVPYGREWGRRLLHPDDQERARKAAERAVAERTDYAIEYRMAERPVWVAARGRGVYDAAGKLVRMHGVVQDITERKLTELELRDADRKKDDFIALLAHELRNPLAPIRNGIQVLRLSDGDTRAASKARDMMDRQLTHMVRLIDDLLDVSRISRNKMELRRERVSVAEVVNLAVEAAQPAIDAANHELIVCLPPDPVYLDADLTRLAQVFSNLLTNSAKYTSQGGKIWLTATRMKDALSVEVRDTGIGIPQTALPNIFDMFSQVDRSIERITGGLGIGLALVKGLTEMHGGTVTAASDSSGSTFTINLPAFTDRPQQQESSPNTHVTPGKGKRILVVDDNRDGAESLSMVLKMLGNVVQTASDGFKAIEQAEDFRPDLILMDIGMPRLNGYEATRQIRGQEWGKNIHIVALTGWGQEADLELSRQSGCDGHLVKPVSLPDLEKLLNS